MRVNPGEFSKWIFDSYFILLLKWEKLKDTFPSDCPNYIHTLYIYIYTLLDEENHIYMYNTEMDRQYIFARPSWYGIVAQLNWLFVASTIFTMSRTHQSELLDRQFAVHNATRRDAFSRSAPVRSFVRCTDLRKRRTIWMDGVWPIRPLNERARAVSVCQYVNASVCVCSSVLFHARWKEKKNNFPFVGRADGRDEWGQMLSSARAPHNRHRIQHFPLLVHWTNSASKMTSHCVTKRFPLASLWLWLKRKKRLCSQRVSCSHSQL